MFFLPQDTETVPNNTKTTVFMLRAALALQLENPAIHKVN